MLLGCIADDFTGAGDLANTLARGGMETRLLIGVPDTQAQVATEAGVIALKTRSIDAADAVAQSLAALAWLRAQGAEQILFKYCSTFDSTPQGNIGPVAEALADALGARGVIVCPAFPANGRTVYQGHLFVGDRLLSESGMERHPLTPMTDPDIRRWLALQSRAAPAHVALDIVRRGPEAIRAALAAADQRLVVVDAITDGDLDLIGVAAAGAPLLTGGSGVAQGLPANFRRAGRLSGRPSGFHGQAGPALVLAGSCSRATRSQVAKHLEHAPGYRVSIERLLAGDPIEDEVRNFIKAHGDEVPLIYSTDAPEAVAALQARFGTGTTAEAVEGLLGRLARWAVEQGFQRIIVAGGETSGAVVSALGTSAMAIGPEIAPGVPALSAVAGGRNIALALKSGNFGDEEFFARALAALAGERA